MPGGVSRGLTGIPPIRKVGSISPSGSSNDLWIAPEVKTHSANPSPKAPSLGVRPGLTPQTPQPWPGPWQMPAGDYNTYLVALGENLVAAGEANANLRLGWEFDDGWHNWSATSYRTSKTGPVQHFFEAAVVAKFHRGWYQDPHLAAPSLYTVIRSTGMSPYAAAGFPSTTIRPKGNARPMSNRPNSGEPWTFCPSLGERSDRDHPIHPRCRLASAVRQAGHVPRGGRLRILFPPDVG